MKKTAIALLVILAAGTASCRRAPLTEEGYVLIRSAATEEIIQNGLEKKLTAGEKTAILDTVAAKVKVSPEEIRSYMEKNHQDDYNYFYK